MKLLDRLNKFKETDFNNKLMNKVRQEYIVLKEFDPAIIEGISKPAAAFCKWVLAADRMESVGNRLNLGIS